MDEKPARMLHSPARSIGLFKRYQVLSIVGNLLDVDVSRDVWLRYFPRFRWPPLGSVRLLRPVISTRILKIEVTLLAASSATIFALKG